jgi:hypothetical protein
MKEGPRIRTPLKDYHVEFPIFGERQQGFGGDGERTTIRIRMMNKTEQSMSSLRQVDFDLEQLEQQ